MIEEEYYGIDKELVEKVKGLAARLCMLAKSGIYSDKANAIRGGLLNDLHNASGFKKLADTNDDFGKWEKGFKRIMKRIENKDIVEAVEFLNENGG